MTSINLKITRNCRWRCSQRRGGKGKSRGGCECFFWLSSYWLDSRFLIVLFGSLSFEVDLSRIPLNESQLYTHMLNPGRGKLVFLVALMPCWGVSISDVESSTLTNAEEKDAIIEKFVSSCNIGFLIISAKWGLDNICLLLFLSEFEKLSQMRRRGWLPSGQHHQSERPSLHRHKW